MPAGVLGAALIIILILAAHGGRYLFDYWCRKKSFKHDNEVAGIIFSIISLIYSLLVSFAIVAVWENYEDLNLTIEKEVDELNTILIHSNMLPDSLKVSVDTAVKEYCQRVVNEEWEQPEGKERFRQSAIPSLRLLLLRAQAAGKAQGDVKMQGDVLSVLDDKLSNITALHRERLGHTHSYVPGLVWMILIVSSAMIVLFSYFLHMDSPQLRKIFLSFLWGIIGMSLFLVYMLDHPFVGSTQVSKAPYEGIIQTLSSE